MLEGSTSTTSSLLRFRSVSRTIALGDFRCAETIFAGGYKASGIGREMGQYALTNYTNVKVSVSLSPLPTYTTLTPPVQAVHLALDKQAPI
jgi:hypothetical protein